MENTNQGTLEKRTRFFNSLNGMKLPILITAITLFSGIALINYALPKDWSTRFAAKQAGKEYEISVKELIDRDISCFFQNADYNENGQVSKEEYKRYLEEQRIK